MALQVTVAGAVGANTPFAITVPGQNTWQLITVCAVLSRVVGGTPNRAIQLAISDGTHTVLTSPALDAGTEPGTLTVTWGNLNPTSVASGSTGVTVGPLAPLTLAAGYVITGTVLSGAAGDQWTSAIAWYDYSYTA